MKEQDILKVLSKVGAVLEGHFKLTSGNHSDRYVNKDAVFPELEESAELAREIAAHFAHHGVEVVVGPAVGGALLARDVARELMTLTGNKVRPVYADKASDGETFVIKRGYDKLVNGRRTLVVEDVLTTGGSAKKVVDATRIAGGIVSGLGVLCNRGGVTPEELADPGELFALLNIKFEKWPPDECPLCNQGVPLNTDVGKGKTK